MKITTKAQLERKIDLALARKAKLLLKLDEARCDFELSSEGMLSERRKLREASDKIERSILRIENVRLKKLSAKLAEIQTIPLGATEMVEGLDQEEVTL